MRICLRGCARAMCIPILTSATVKPARPSLARRVPVVPGRPCPSRPSRRRVRRARRACRHRRPRRARRPRPAHGDPHSSREPPGPTDVAISAGTPRTPSSGFRDPEMSRMCRGPTVDSKNAGIHTRTPGRRGPTVVDRGPRDDLPPRDLRTDGTCPGGMLGKAPSLSFLRCLGAFILPLGFRCLGA